VREHPIMQRVIHALSQGVSRLFRVNTGTAWAGDGRPVRAHGKPMQVTLFPGDVLLRSAQPIKMGLVVGGSDCIGWTSVVISPSMVGRKVAVFTGVEVKRDDKPAKPTEEQLIFIGNVQEAGGIAGVAQSADEALALVQGWRSDMGC